MLTDAIAILHEIELHSKPKVIEKDSYFLVVMGEMHMSCVLYEYSVTASSQYALGVKGKFTNVF